MVLNWMQFYNVITGIFPAVIVLDLHNFLISFLSFFFNILLLLVVAVVVLVVIELVVIEIEEEKRFYKFYWQAMRFVPVEVPKWFIFYHLGMMALFKINHIYMTILIHSCFFNENIQ